MSEFKLHVLRLTKREIELVIHALNAIGDYEIISELNEDLRLTEQCENLAARIDEQMKGDGA